MFFSEHIDVVYFVYGSAFIYLGYAVLSRARYQSRHAIAKPLKLLGIFGLTHGLLELLDFWELLKGEGPVFFLGNVILKWLSFLYLFEFGRRMLSLSLPMFRHAVWGHLPILAVMITLLITSQDIRSGVDIGSRYLLGFPGGVMAGAGLILYGYKNRALLKRHQHLFLWSGIGLIVYGLLAGSVVGNSGREYALLATQDEFISLVGSPVQLWRALIAIGLAISVGRLLGLFEEEVRERQILASRVVDSTSEGVMVTDCDSVITHVNRAFEKTTGYTESEVLGKTPRILNSDRQGPEFYQSMWKSLSDNGFWKGEIWNRRKNGEIYPEWLTVSPITDSDANITHYVGMFSDISHQEHFQEKLHHLAYYDGLTGLPNRTLFRDRLDTAIEMAKRKDGQLALMFLDLDNFKNINDTLGHVTGDQLLVAVARRLQGMLRDEDTVSRLGGDEFTVILPDIKDGLSLARLAEKILAMLQQPFLLDGSNYVVTTSIGICLYPQNGERSGELLKHADTAMYQAKESGKSRFVFYSNELSEKYRKRLSLEHDLRNAISNNQLSLAYQPQYRVGTREIIGAEALLRWQHPTTGWVSPADFIPVAEESGLIIEIGKWVIEQVCGQIREWGSPVTDKLKIAINVSAVQFDDMNLEKFIQETIALHSIHASNLVIELTEGSLSKNRERVSAVMDQLVSSGVEIAIDDFGTGYSSLSYLKQFPISKLKIDKSFVDGLPDDINDGGISKAVIALAKALGMSVIAEGVETEEQLAFLVDNGCEEIQGYLYSRPIGAREFGGMLASCQPG